MLRHGLLHVLMPLDHLETSKYKDMKIWLLENGEKSGPFESFTVRERIDSGELKADTQSWYQGAEGWGPLSDIPQFSSLFEDKVEVATPPPIPQRTTNQAILRKAIQEERAKAPPIYLTRRLFARLHDCILYMSLVFIVFKERALDAMDNESMMPLLGIGLAYVILDGIMTNLWKCSPGKFLLGMRVTDVMGYAIPLKFALLRSLRVWILGLGMWVMWPISLTISWFMSRRLGYFLWDLPKRYRVVARPFSGLHVISYMVSIFVMSTLLNLALPKQMIEDMNQRSGAQEFLDSLNK